MSIVVYTAVAGNYDYLGPHRFEDGVDYVFFTDGLSRPVQDRWKVVELPNLAHLHPRRVAKIPKLFPHYFDVLKGYRHAVWIDGDMQIVSTRFTAELLAYLKRGILLSPHFDGRDCGYGEATIRPPKYACEPLDPQVAYYHREGFPEHFGLFEGGVIARKMDDPEVRELGQFWLLQNFMFSYQDQVSLPYSLWKTGVVPSVLPRSFRDCGWVVINAHRSGD